MIAENFATHTIDWGTRRGQGRRSGGQVKGAMSAAPQGIKTYIDFRASVPGGMSDAEWDEVRLFGDEGMTAYVIARQQGVSHHDACVTFYRSMATEEVAGWGDSRGEDDDAKESR